MDDILAGYGQPVDEIDSACKRYKQCVKCAMNDFGNEVCPWYKPYKMTAMVDTETGEKHLVCKDKDRVLQKNDRFADLFTRSFPLGFQRIKALT